MVRTIAIAAMLALALPTLAAAQAPPPPGGHGPHPHGPPPRGPAPHGPPPRGPAPHGPPAPGFRGPHPAGAQFIYRGHPINRIHVAPFVYPHGWAYRRWAVGALLPPLFLTPDYFYTGWAGLGLPPPPPGDQWVRYGPDLLLVNVATGQVVDVAYGVFY